MTKQFKTFLSLSIAAFFVLGIFLISAVKNISISYDGGGYHGASVNEDYLAQRIAEEMAKQQQNLFSSVKEECLSLDSKTLTMEFAVTAMPREFTDSTTALLLCGDQQASMQLKDGVFTGSIAIPLSGQMNNEYTIVLQDGKQYRTQIFPLEAKAFASGQQVFGLDGNSMEYSETTVRVEQGFELDESLLPFDDKALSARIYALKEGKEIYTESLQNGRLKMDYAFERNDDIPVWFYGEVVGQSGMIYRYQLTDSISIASIEWDGVVMLQVITPDGKTIDLPVY